MKKYLVSFSTGHFKRSQERLVNSALKNGIDETKIYNYKKIKSTPFYRENKYILDQKRGAGYWLWKPYIILEVMKDMEDGDFIIYSDSGIEIIRDINILTKICAEQEGILLFNVHGKKNKEWTKKDCFILMGCDSEEYYNDEQIMAGFQAYIKNEKSNAFLNELLLFSRNPHILDDSSSILGQNSPDFNEHRHDQSVLSILAAKHKINGFRDPSQFGNHLKIESYREPCEWLQESYSLSPCKNSNYYTLINHHREKCIPVHSRIYGYAKKIRTAILKKYLIKIRMN
jgi:hypothetical protein